MIAAVYVWLRTGSFQATSVDIGALTSSQHTSDSRYENQFLFLHRRFRLSSPDELPPITLATCSVVNCASQACVVWCFSGGRVGVLFGNFASVLVQISLEFEQHTIVDVTEAVNYVHVNHCGLCRPLESS